MQENIRGNFSTAAVLGFTLVGFIFLIVGIIVVQQVNGLNGYISSIYLHPLQVSNASQRISVGIHKMHKSMKDVTQAESEEGRAFALHAVASEEMAVMDQLDLVRQRIIGDGGKKLEAETRALFVSWKPIRESVIALTREGKTREAFLVTAEKGAHHVLRLEELTQKIVQYALDKASEMRAEAENVRRKAIGITIAVIILGVAVAAVVALITLRALRQEVTLRQGAQLKLEEAHQALEAKVEERTADLQDANTRLQQLDRLKSLFMATMSHELRTPLNAIIGFTGVMLKGMTGELNEEQEKQLGMVKTNSHHLLKLINDVIDVGKIESGHVDINITEFDMTQVVSEIGLNFEHDLNSKQLRLGVKAPERFLIRSDEGRVRQVITNFVSNAIKFTEDGEVSVSLARREGRAAVTVADTGIGIEAKDQGQLFQAFSRGHNHEKMNVSGTGLGLYLSRKIATLLGGTIEVESAKGKGSRFTFEIPVSPP